MFRALLKSKIRRATVTQCEPNDAGSCAINEDLLDPAKLAEHEQVHRWNINNGEDCITYTIRAEPSCRMIEARSSIPMQRA